MNNRLLGMNTNQKILEVSMDISTLLQRIEHLRKQLNEEAINSENLIADSVLCLSQELDNLINLYYYFMRAAK